VTDRAQLADRLALAIVEHGPSAATALANRVAARKADVLAELKAKPMFVHEGRGRGSKWRLDGNRCDPLREPLGTDPRDDLGLAVTRDEFDLLRRRVDELERLLAEVRA
jgi:hypothetical protein